MIIDGRNTSALPQEQYDIVIVGAGPAGIALAHELAGTGASIALLESGGLEYDADSHLLNDGELSGNTETDLLASRLRFLGGTSNHWGGHCMPLDRIDFERGPLNSMSGWPFSYEDLLPHYIRAHTYCDLGDFNYSIEQEGSPSDRELLFPNDPDISTVVFRQSPPTRFGEKYREFLEDSPSIEVWLWSNAIDLVSDGTERLTAVCTRTLGGLDRKFSSQVVVLACGCVEATRLLMYSNERNERSFGDENSLLGKCYMDHPSGGAAFVELRDPMPEKAYWRPVAYYQNNGVPIRHLLRLTDNALIREGLANCHFFLFPFAMSLSEQERRRSSREAYQSLRSIGKWVLNKDPGPTFSLSEEYCSFVLNADSFVEEQWASVFDNEGVRRILLKYEAEQQPDRSSALTLTDKRDDLGVPRVKLHWSPSEDDLESIVESAKIVGEAVGRADIGRLRLESDDGSPYWNSVTAWHQLGTTRMAKSASMGVVDENCRVFGTSNLYIASGSVMPTSGRANPTLTIVALAIRLADHLKARRAN